MAKTPIERVKTRMVRSRDVKTGDAQHWESGAISPRLHTPVAENK